MTQQYVSNSTLTPGNSGNEVTFSLLGYPDSVCKEAWLLARAAPQNNGRPLRVRLYSHTNTPLCDEAQLYGESFQRVRLQNVNISTDSQPPVIRVVCSNEADQDALVAGVLLTY